MRPNGNIIWQQKFQSEADVIKAGGTIYGSPTFGRDGVKLDGASDYFTYDVDTIFQGLPFTAVIEFTPEFDYDDGLSYYLIGSNDYTEFSYIKFSNNFLYCRYHFNTVIAPTAWKPNKRNVLVLSISQASLKSIYLNGVLEDTNGSVITGTTQINQISIGAHTSGSFPFLGTFHSVTFYREALTAEDAKQLYNRSTYNYQNKSDIWLDFNSVYGLGTVADPYKTTDKSGNGRDCLLGDGSTVATIPDFLAPGMDLDGSNNYLKIDNAEGLLNNDEQTFVLCFSPGFTLDSGVNEYILDSTNGDYRITVNSGGFLVVVLGGTSIFSVPKSTLEPFWSKGENVLIIGGKDGDTCAWVNAFPVAENDTTSWSSTAISDLFIGAKNDTSSFYTGKIHHFSTYPFKMGRLQVNDITQKLLRG